MLEDHEFHPKLGRLKSRERAPKLFVAQVLAAAQLAGHVGGNWPGPHDPQPGIPARAAAAAAWPPGASQSDGCTVIVRAG